MGKKGAELGNKCLSRKMPHWTEKVRVWTKKGAELGNEIFEKKVPNWTKKVRNRKPADLIRVGLENIIWSQNI